MIYQIYEFALTKNTFYFVFCGGTPQQTCCTQLWHQMFCIISFPVLCDICILPYIFFTEKKHMYYEVDTINSKYLDTRKDK